GGTRTVFSLRDIGSVTWNQQTGDNPPRFTPAQLSFGRLRSVGVDQIAFGKYLSPDYEVHPGEYFPPVGSLTGVPEVRATNEIYFNLVLPGGPKPAGGWPVAIINNGLQRSKDLPDTWTVAASMAAQGIATIAINTVGHGFGPM